MQGGNPMSWFYTKWLGNFCGTIGGGRTDSSDFVDDFDVNVVASVNNFALCGFGMYAGRYHDVGIYGASAALVIFGWRVYVHLEYSYET